VVEVYIGAAVYDVLVEGRSMSISSNEISRSRVLSQMIGGATQPQLSLRLPCGYLQAWLACIRLQSHAVMRSLDTSVKMLNVRCVS
jgi:hypothetical protein